MSRIGEGVVFHALFEVDGVEYLDAVRLIDDLPAGIPLTTNIPFGYRKDPEDRTKWVVDEAAALVVKRIFKLCMEGRGPMQIAKLLQAEQVLNPTAYARHEVA